MAPSSQQAGKESMGDERWSSRVSTQSGLTRMTACGAGAWGGRAACMLPPRAVRFANGETQEVAGFVQRRSSQHLGVQASPSQQAGVRSAPGQGLPQPAGHWSRTRPEHLQQWSIRL